MRARERERERNYDAIFWIPRANTTGTNTTPIIILTLRILAKDLWYYYAGNQVPVVYCPPLTSSSSSSSTAVAIVAGVVYDYLMSW